MLILLLFISTTASPDMEKTLLKFLDNTTREHVSKTKELTIDFRKKGIKTHTPVHISDAKVQQVIFFRKPIGSVCRF